MKICAGCEAEYAEDFKFCPECGRPFGGTEAATGAERMNAHLRQLAGSASGEVSQERALRSPRGFDRQPVFELSEGARAKTDLLSEQIVAGMPGTSIDEDGYGDGQLV